MKNIIIAVLAIICLWSFTAMVQHECATTGPGWNCSEYQLTLEEPYLKIENCGRLVALVPYDQIGVLDSIFVVDNE